jgi:hypothetical protein
MPCVRPAATCTHKREQYTQNGARPSFASFDRLYKRFEVAAALNGQAAATSNRMAVLARVPNKKPRISSGVKTIGRSRSKSVNELI